MIIHTGLSQHRLQSIKEKEILSSSTIVDGICHSLNRFAEKNITLYFMAVIAKSRSFLRKIRPVPFNSSGVPIRLPSRLAPALR
ncbi:MAG: hypothetical protein IJM72_05485 [Deltaproteobacteria bacterium]|nr:hypothetical protein [Deltaproteobacteria bacterium]